MSVSSNALLGHQNPSHISLLGVSGTIYELAVYPLGQFFKKLPGVYAVCKQTGPQTFSVLYIGETHDLDNRVGQGFPSHHKWAAAILNGATHICALVVGGDRSRRLAVEADLRQSYRPPLNDQ